MTFGKPEQSFAKFLKIQLYDFGDLEEDCKLSASLSERFSLDFEALKRKQRSPRCASSKFLPEDDNPEIKVNRTRSPDMA